QLIVFLKSWHIYSGLGVNRPNLINQLSSIIFVCQELTGKFLVEIHPRKLIIHFASSKLFSSKESSYLIWDSEIVQIRLISILCGQASICQIPFFIVPLFQSAIIEQFQIILNDKRNNIIFQAFFKHNQ